VPPRTVYTREDIEAAALALVAEQGLEALSARAVARRMGCSTAPVYSQFRSMDDLARAVLLRAKARLQGHATATYTGRVFLDMGVGIVSFARDHAPLFRALFLEGDDYRDLIEEFHEEMLGRMADDPALRSLSRAQREALLSRMATFTHGLAAMVCAGLAASTDQEAIVAALSDVGRAVVGAALAEAAGDQHIGSAAYGTACQPDTGATQHAETT
jgi:AcrR family transcriptional regulator